MTGPRSARRSDAHRRHQPFPAINLTTNTKPNTIAGNKIATKIGGRAPLGATASGTRIKNNAANEVVMAHWANSLRNVSPRFSSGNGPSSGQQPLAARAILLAVWAERLSVPTTGLPN